MKLFRYFVEGPYDGRVLTTAKKIGIKSISEDAVFAATSGRRRPVKHLQIEMTIKKLTVSRKVITNVELH